MTEERLVLAELLEKAGDGDFLRAVAEAVLQLLMESDVEGMIGAGRYERSGERSTWRNGYRDRTLDTRLGRLFLERKHTAGGIRALQHHRGAFSAWNGRCYPDAEDDVLRAELYMFLDHCATAGTRGELHSFKPNMSTTPSTACTAASNCGCSMASTTITGSSRLSCST